MARRGERLACHRGAAETPSSVRDLEAELRCPGLAADSGGRSGDSDSTLRGGGD